MGIYSYYKETQNTTNKQEETKMTKRETAKEVAIEMNKINNNVNITRMIGVLMKGMTAHELEKALEGYRK